MPNKSRVIRHDSVYNWPPNIYTRRPKNECVENGDNENNRKEQQVQPKAANRKNVEK